jgi:hypothetical protein
MKKLPASTTLKEARKAGRMGDTELVHLNKSEVQMLEGMTHGHGLTINPQTGEKEAFLPFLLSMLPTLFPTLGASLGLSGALASPLALGAIGSGLGTWAETGDLGKGLMAGLGGAALGGIGGKLLGGLGNTAGDLGNLAAKGAAGSVGGAASGAANQTVKSLLANAGNVGGKTAALTAAAAPAAGNAMAGMGKLLAPMVVGAPGAYLTAQDQMKVVETDRDRRKKASIERAQHENFMGPRTMNQAPGDYRHGMDEEFKFFTPGGTLTPVTTERGFADGGLIEALTPFSPMLSLMRGKMPLGIPGLLDFNKPGTPESRAREEEEKRLQLSAPRGYASGGMVGPQVMPLPGQPQVQPRRPMMTAPRGIGPRPMMSQPAASNMGVWGGLQLPPRQIPTPYDPMANARGRGLSGGGGTLGDGSASEYTGGYNPAYSGGFPQMNSMGGVGSAPLIFRRDSGVQQFAEGGMVMGPGDGTSDSVPAVINGAEPAALSDGEFVVPAMAVAALGNGSSKAGAEKLQQMVNSLLAAQ